MERYRILFSGSGGQGVITAAIFLAEAAVLYEGLNSGNCLCLNFKVQGTWKGLEPECFLTLVLDPVELGKKSPFFFST